MMTPNENTSLALVQLCPRKISGASHRGLTPPPLVTTELIPHSSAESVSSLLRPMSATLTVQSAPTSKLGEFKSR